MFCAVDPAPQRKTSVTSDIRRNIIRFSDPTYSCVGGLGDPAPAPDGNIFVRRTINRSKWTDCTAGFVACVAHTVVLSDVVEGRKADQTQETGDLTTDKQCQPD